MLTRTDQAGVCLVARLTTIGQRCASLGGWRTNPASRIAAVFSAGSYFQFDGPGRQIRVRKEYGALAACAAQWQKAYRVVRCSATGRGEISTCPRRQHEDSTAARLGRPGHRDGRRSAKAVTGMKIHFEAPVAIGLEVVRGVETSRWRKNNL